MSLYRAHAYRMARMDRYHDSMDCVAFFEAADPELALPTVRRLVAGAWNVPQTEVDTYGVFDEATLLAISGMSAAAGDMRLLEIGWNCGPLFADPVRVMVFGRPLTLARLHGAAEQVRLWKANPANQLMYAGMPRPYPNASAAMHTQPPPTLRRMSDWPHAAR